MKYFTDALFLFSTFFVVTLNYKFSFFNLVMAMCCSFSVGLSIRYMTIYMRVRNSFFISSIFV